MTKPGRNDPCPCGSGKKYKHCHLGKPDDPALLVDDAPPSVRLAPGERLPAAVSDFTLPSSWATGGLDPGLWGGDERPSAYDPYDDLGPMTPEEEAWDLIDLAFEDGPTAEWPKDAKAALQLYPRCSGAVYLQAKWEQDLDKQLVLLEQAIRFAEEETGEERFAELAPGSWEDPHVEYGMLAKSDRAFLLIALDRAEDALAALEELQRLDPTDRLGAGSRRMTLLVSLERPEEALAVAHAMTAPPLGDETYLFTRALAAYAVYGDTLFARRALAEAMVTFPDGYGTLADLLAVEAEIADGESPDDADDEELALAELDELAADLIDDLGHDPTGPEIEGLLEGMAGLLTLVAAWDTIPGAAAWLHDVRAAGPGVRNAIETDPAGPPLAIGGIWDDNHNCHLCGGRAKSSPLALVLLVEPDDLLPVPKVLRACTRCGALNVPISLLIDALIDADPARAGRDFEPIGVVDPAALGPAEPDKDAILAALQRPSRLTVEGEEQEEWPTEESREAEIQGYLDQVTSADLFGPIDPFGRR